jgi:thioredoxin-like negative regulator of GroEL
MTGLISRLLFVLALVASAPAQALGTPYEQAQFDRLMAGGQPVLVWIHADWCPTCKAQGRILPALLSQPGLADITLLKIDFDRQRPLLRQFRVSQQSTLIMFRDGRETGRSIGDTRPASLRALLAKAP